MANFKRKRAKLRVLSYCGVANCRYDSSPYKSLNGRERYTAMYWKRVGGRQAWRYNHKNVIAED